MTSLGFNYQKPPLFLPNQTRLPSFLINKIDSLLLPLTRKPSLLLPLHLRSPPLSLRARRPDSGELLAAHGGVDRRGLTQRPPSFLLQPSDFSHPFLSSRDFTSLNPLMIFPSPIHLHLPPEASKSSGMFSYWWCLADLHALTALYSDFSFVFRRVWAVNDGGEGELQYFLVLQVIFPFYFVFLCFFLFSYKSRPATLVAIFRWVPTAVHGRIRRHWAQVVIIFPFCFLFSLYRVRFEWRLNWLRGFWSLDQIIS